MPTMHLFQYRPAAPQRKPPGDAAPGKCYWARQSSLFFGNDRHQQVAWRRVISWAVRGELVHVLPTTTQRNNDFLMVGRERCTLTRPNQNRDRDSYVCPRVEVLPKTELLEVGVLQGPAWLGIVQWKREREGRR
jgi:hypothetical protein